MIFSYTLLVKMLYIKGICKGTSRIIFFNENFVHFQFKFCFKKVVQMTSNTFGTFDKITLAKHS